jgi:hypothetical protein
MLLSGQPEQRVDQNGTGDVDATAIELPLPDNLHVVVNDEKTPDARFEGDLKLRPVRQVLNPPDGIALSCASGLSVQLTANERKPARLDVQFHFLGDAKDERRIRVDLKGRDTSGQVIHHTWQLASDVRTEKEPEPVGRIKLIRNTYSSVRLEIPQYLLPALRTLEISLREMSVEDRKHFPDEPSKTDMTITRPDAEGRFTVSFQNPINENEPGRWALDPERHQVIFQVLVKDAEGKLQDRIFRQLAARPTDGYRETVQMKPEWFDHSSVSVTFVTIQPDHDTWVDDFFKKGTGTRYNGLWSADSGPLTKIMLNEAKGNAAVPPPPNREPIGEVLGKPVYRDEVKDETLHGIFLGPVWKKYREAHRAAITPTAAELKFAADFFDEEHRQRIVAEGGEAKLRKQIERLEQRIAGDNLIGAEEKKLKVVLVIMQEKLKPPSSYGFASFILDNWKFQKHLYDNFGGGRVLWQQAGLEAFDATRTCLESLEKQGEFKITDARLRAKLYEYWTRNNHPGLFTDNEVIRREFLEPKWIAPAVAKAPPRAGQDDAIVVSGIVRGVVRIDGEVPEVPPLKLRPSFRGTIPRNEEERRRNQQAWEAASVVEIPDESLVVSKEGGIANVAVYLKKVPKDWKPTEPPKEPFELRAEGNRFHSRVSLIRVGQPLRLANRGKDAVNFHSSPLMSEPFNIVVRPDLTVDTRERNIQAERLPFAVNSDIQPWMKSWLLVLDHPFAAITDSDGRFEIRDLPPGEHHFTVWHERPGYLNKDLVVRVEDDKVTEINLNYTAEQLERRNATTAPARPTNMAAVPEHPNPAVANLIRQFGEQIANQSFAEAELTAKQANELDPENPKLQRLMLVASYGRRLATDKDQPKRSSRMSIAYIERMMDTPERLKSNDREAAAKLVGRWKLTLPAGFVYNDEIKQTNDGLLSFDGSRQGVLYGKFAVHDDQMRLVDPNNKEIDDYVWRVESLNKLSLVISKTQNGADYTGATLERLADE